MSAKALACVRSTTASGSAIYETECAVHEYLQFHYEEPSTIVPYDFAPLDALQFLPRIVERCSKLSNLSQRGRGLDLGCAVGRATFELSKYYDEVIGIDFSRHFANAAKAMKEKGIVEYKAHIQGDIFEVRWAKLPAGAKPDHVDFFQGDACNLSPSLGKFDAVLAINLLCRLPEPKIFLTKISEFINSDGILVLVSPYSWLEEYTTKDKWIGGVCGADGKPVESFNDIKKILSRNFDLIERRDYPFMIREHERKYQWGVSDGSFWKRK
ncbi:Putative 4-mercaptohistidine N1-methyltranferase, OvoA C-terminal domain [Plasmopara halstedii]|uniref:Putative 4-mercaptohistidine N1-methyltranferase, OvoA C-terminal domain n=1 Tax=Plasmopara halstedii TaxID=4781 RepID=A0A0P1ADS1_PLAHL|nr:Putative 4-mercaptohistidine N1-methyltranferase, OvoA C-terminal domain [Plasmopara halstedii]CEG38624.1 Putative 4-mercaptohistidine N1-methyltranferase, OvoA C-terminal domain [Plasmopara halstedii]|eukprot:XP_024574993.1 Putative 4-mercaptohistidine N1-methyltranferase, OvoA C-terminal domain [Plasmopara halstedii]